MDKKIIGLAGTLLLGVATWLISTVYSISIDTAIIKEKLEKVYQDDCPYCIHAAHSSISEHPLLAPTIKHSHRHIGKETVSVNN
tara:strand:- start:136 stop:387 length:252 start_codon:yes stop_codon:yes gene_type:complete